MDSKITLTYLLSINASWELHEDLIAKASITTFDGIFMKDEQAEELGNMTQVASPDLAANTNSRGTTNLCVSQHDNCSEKKEYEGDIAIESTPAIEGGTSVEKNEYLTSDSTGCADGQMEFPRGKKYHSNISVLPCYVQMTCLKESLKKVKKPTVVSENSLAGINKKGSKQELKKKCCKNKTCDKTIMKNEVKMTQRKKRICKKEQKCWFCSKVFDTSSELAYHLKTHDDRPYACQQCDQKFRWSSNLRVHMRIHSGEKPYKCSICDHQFSRYGSLEVHHRTHTDEKPYNCSVCNKWFRDERILRRHMMTVHSDDALYDCTICGKKFKRKDGFQTHIRTHTGEKPFKCPYCTQFFGDSTTLWQHKLTHTNERRHQCSICDKKFKRKSSLKTHVMIHTEERPHKCEVCSKCFRTRTHMKRHAGIHFKLKKKDTDH